MTHRPDTEFFSLVQAAEGAIIPGAIPGDSEHQALSFAWRPNWPKFKALVVFAGFHIFGSYSPSLTSRKIGDGHEVG
jgi:hypothetical protein